MPYIWLFIILNFVRESNLAQLVLVRYTQGHRLTLVRVVESSLPFKNKRCEAPFRPNNIVMFQAVKLKRKRAAEKMRRYRAHRANTDPTFRLKEAEKKRSQRKRDKGTISCEKLEEMRRLNRIRQIRFREKRRSDRTSAGSSAEHKPEVKTRPEHDKQRPTRVCKVKQETV